MTTQVIQADPVRDVCDQLARYLADLRPLLPEPDSPGAHAIPGAKGRVAHAPLPGNAAALLASTGIHGFARWWEAILLWEHGASGPWNRRGGSDANTLLALKAIVKLVAGASGDAVEMLLGDLCRAEADAAVHPAIDEAQQWRRIRNHPCRYCGCYYLEVLLGKDGQATTHIECHAAASVGCRDGRGLRPAATLTADGIQWADGRTENVRRLDAA